MLKKMKVLWIALFVTLGMTTFAACGEGNVDSSSVDNIPSEETTSNSEWEESISSEDVDFGGNSDFSEESSEEDSSKNENQPPEKDKILILERNEQEAETLENLLANEQDYQITTLNILEDEIPLTVDALTVYEQIILVNVANADMPNGFDEALHSYVYDLGGNLFTVGGNDEKGEENTYQRDDMYDTLYQEMLPVEAIEYTAPIAVMFIVDTSGSMMQEMEQGRTYFDCEKMALLAGIEAFTERDYVGIMSFDTVNSVVLPLTPLTEKTKITTAIDSLNTAGGGSIFLGVLERAGQALKEIEKVGRRHIVMLTDGVVSDSPEEYEPIIDHNYKEYGITLSIVGVDFTLEDYPYYWDDIVENIGHGRLYKTNTLAEMISAAQGEIRSQINKMEHETFSLQIAAEYADLYGISSENLPTLDGFYGTKLKKEAVAIVTGIYGTPIYAQWTYGKGVVGSFMCDLNGAWSQDLLQNAEGISLMKKLIFGIIPAPADNS